MGASQGRRCRRRRDCVVVVVVAAATVWGGVPTSFGGRGHRAVPLYPARRSDGAYRGCLAPPPARHGGAAVG